MHEARAFAFRQRATQAYQKAMRPNIPDETRRAWLIIERDWTKMAEQEEAKLEEAKLEEAKLEEAKLEEAKLEEAKLEEAKLEEAKLKERPSWKRQAERPRRAASPGSKSIEPAQQPSSGIVEGVGGSSRRDKVGQRSSVKAKRAEFQLHKSISEQVCD